MIDKQLLSRAHRELLDVLNSINQDKIHHDGDDFHELLNDIEKALAQPEQTEVQQLIALVRAQQITIDKLETALADHSMREVQRLGQEIECPDCKAEVLYECVACSSNNYPPPQRTEPIQSLQCFHCQDTIETLNGKVMQLMAQRKPLTNDEIALINADYPHPQGFARAIEAKLKEKNT
jgi:hypothetical protein